MPRSPCRLFRAYKGCDTCPPAPHCDLRSERGGLGLRAERGRADLPYRSRGGASRHLCAVTASPACQRFPGRELPSPMLTARQPDELSVSSNSPHTSHSTAPPGRSHCFTFHWALLLYSELDVYLSSLSIGTWQPQYLAGHVTEKMSTEDCGARGRFHSTGWQGDNCGLDELCGLDTASVRRATAASQLQKLAPHLSARQIFVMFSSG